MTVGLRDLKPLKTVPSALNDSNIEVRTTPALVIVTISSMARDHVYVSKFYCISALLVTPSINAAKIWSESIPSLFAKDGFTAHGSGYKL